MRTTDSAPRPSSPPQTGKSAATKKDDTWLNQDSSKESMVERLDSLFTTLRASKISMSACHAIIKLYMANGSDKESLILSKLASKIGVTTAAITSVADCMEAHGLAKRHPDPRDRRIVVISITPKGMTFAETFGAAAHS